MLTRPETGPVIILFELRWCCRVFLQPTRQHDNKSKLLTFERQLCLSFQINVNSHALLMMTIQKSEFPIPLKIWLIDLFIDSWSNVINNQIDFQFWMNEMLLISVTQMFEMICQRENNDVKINPFFKFQSDALEWFLERRSHFQYSLLCLSLSHSHLS